LPSAGDVLGLDPRASIARLFPSIRQRLEMIDPNLTAELVDAPTFRQVEMAGHRCIWPIINKQGLEWYGNTPISACDFMDEAVLGLHDGARVFYDFGGHHGVWALFYALTAGPTGRVYSFEPSIMNVEVSALLLLVNGIENVVNIGMAIGPSGAVAANADLLVDFVPRESLQCIGLRDACWDHGDFLKMDIEGYEYELLTGEPWIFDIATNLHIELHIPHLEDRGLDYRRVMDAIPFDRFDVFNHRSENRVFSDTLLSGFCGLMLRRRGQAPSRRVDSAGGAADDVLR